jgi:DNA-binding CsgD family transcriptional regulator
MAASDMGQASPAPRLTARELQCVQMAARGMTTSETARALEVTERTVEFHIANAVRKLGAATKLRAVVLALQQRLIDP